MYHIILLKKKKEKKKISILKISKYFQFESHKFKNQVLSISIFHDDIVKIITL